MDQPLTVATVLTRGLVALPAEWVWLARDPAAMRLCVFHAQEMRPPRPVPSSENPPERARKAAVWCVARERLRDGLAGRHCGPGHVVLRASPARRHLLQARLWTADGWWCGVTDSRVAARFLDETYAHVSPEREAGMLAAAAHRLDPDRLAELEGETS